MEGVVVTGIPAHLTYGDLQSYFHHGRSELRYLLYPFTEEQGLCSAVVTFKDIAESREAMARQHKLGGATVRLSPVPTQVYTTLSAVLSPVLVSALSRLDELLERYLEEGIINDLERKGQSFKISGDSLQLQYVQNSLSKKYLKFLDDQQKRVGNMTFTSTARQEEAMEMKARSQSVDVTAMLNGGSRHRRRSETPDSTRSTRTIKEEKEPKRSQVEDPRPRSNSIGNPRARNVRPPSISPTADASSSPSPTHKPKLVTSSRPRDEREVARSAKLKAVSSTALPNYHSKEPSPVKEEETNLKYTYSSPSPRPRDVPDYGSATLKEMEEEHLQLAIKESLRKDEKREKKPESPEQQWGDRRATPTSDHRTDLDLQEDDVIIAGGSRDEDYPSVSPSRDVHARHSLIRRQEAPIDPSDADFPDLHISGMRSRLSLPVSLKAEPVLVDALVYAYMRSNRTQQQRLLDFQDKHQVRLVAEPIGVDDITRITIIPQSARVAPYLSDIQDAFTVYYQSVYSNVSTHKVYAHTRMQRVKLNDVVDGMEDVYKSKVLIQIDPGHKSVTLIGLQANIDQVTSVLERRLQQYT